MTEPARTLETIKAEVAEARRRVREASDLLADALRCLPPEVSYRLVWPVGVSATTTIRLNVSVDL